MRRALKLLLLLGIGLFATGPRPPDGDSTPTTPGTTDPADNPKVRTPDGANAVTDWGGAKAEIDKKLTDGETKDSDNDGTPDIAETPTQSLEPNYPDQWASQENLRSHYESHKDDPGMEDIENDAQYGEAAIDLMSTDGGRRPGVRIKTEGETSYFYDPATGEFGRSGPRGVITYYIPYPNPEAHFNRQPGTEV